MPMTINHHYPEQRRLGSADQPYQGWTRASDPFYYSYRTVAQTQPDQQGRLLSRTTTLWFALNEAMDNVILTNAQTGERLLTAQETYTLAAEPCRVRQAVAAQTRAAIQRVEAAEAEILRLRALLASQE